MPIQAPPNYLIEAAEEAAHEFGAALEGEGLPEWQLMFRLAKRLQGVPGALQGDISSMKPAVEAFCGILEEEEWLEERWIAFVDAWYKVRIPDGYGPLEIAFEQARKERIIPIPELSPDFVLVASMAYHLQRLQGGEPIFLPVNHVGKLLGKGKMHGSRLIQLLVRKGLIYPVNEKYSFTKHRAKTYRFIFDSGRYKIEGQLANEGSGNR